MPNETEPIAKKGEDVLRDVASSQGAAYVKYGEALERYGLGHLSAGELFKVGADLYLGEVGYVASRLFDAASDVFRSALGNVGVIVDDPAPAKKEAASRKRAG